MDPKLARGHVRQEMRSINKHVGLLKQVEDMANQGALWPIHEGRKTSPEALKALANRIANTFADSPNTLAIQRRSSPKTLSRKKFFEDIRAVVLMPNTLTGEATIECVSHMFEVDAYTTTCGTPPVQIYNHAYERLLERRGADKEAAWSLSHDVMGMIGVIGLMMRPVWSFPERKIGIPLRGGILLGGIETTFHGKPTSGINLYSGGRATKGHIQDFKENWPGFLMDMETQTALAMHGRTYVGPQELYDNQIRFMERMDAFRAKHETVLAGVGVALAFPYAKDAASFLHVEGPHAAAIDEACEELIDIIMEPAMARAMGNTVLPTARPERPTLFFQREYQARKERRGAVVDDIIAQAIKGP